jgi:hypothetical protein
MTSIVAAGLLDRGLTARERLLIMDVTVSMMRESPWLTQFLQPIFLALGRPSSAGNGTSTRSAICCAAPMSRWSR